MSVVRIKRPNIILLTFLALLGMLPTACGRESGDINTGSAFTHTITLTSSAFTNNATIPIKYTCSGDDVSPPLSWVGIPEATKSFVLICEDPDAPGGTFVHWVVFNIPGSIRNFDENITNHLVLSSGFSQGKNDFGEIVYGGPCPPKGSSPHHYIFKIYALATTLDVPAGATREKVVQAMEGNILDQTSLVGLYGR